MIFSCAQFTRRRSTKVIHFTLRCRRNTFHCIPSVNMYITEWRKFSGSVLRYENIWYGSFACGTICSRRDIRNNSTGCTHFVSSLVIRSISRRMNGILEFTLTRTSELFSVEIRVAIGVRAFFPLLWTKHQTKPSQWRSIAFVQSWHRLVSYYCFKSRKSIYRCRFYYSRLLQSPSRISSFWIWAYRWLSPLF